ncbi:hypothetical protein CERSUDRAFT_112280 [Gelatoporia subvermispora B]|uniref:Uncharacterized protein n=1 Tax=Ceriporiopsis subvermispora (strain B) TaxID=914234 RepID=M2RNP5_CERS8|nr:hypothetical protein CERSUDRAFT_112280 [Gelatoporia subvermispora B]
MTIPALTASSIAHRARISSALKALKPPQFRMEVVKLRAHQIPTKWSLYRNLLRTAPTKDIRWRVRMGFRQDKSLRRAGDVRRSLEKWHKWLDTFQAARNGDAHLQAVLSRYSRLIVAKRKKEEMHQMILDDIAWRQRHANRPVLKGSALRPSLYNRPLPMMTPMPMHVSGMIARRRKARARRQDRYAVLSDLSKDLESERTFESLLAQSIETPFRPEYSPNLGDWKHWITEEQRMIRESYELDNERARTPFPSELLESLKSARRAKVENKTRERARERSGEVLDITLKRHRGQPPAHLLDKMSEKEKHMDQVSRSPSEVGYVAQVKRALGHKLRNPDAWKVELGKPENREQLDEAQGAIDAENARRRAQAKTDEDS